MPELEAAMGEAVDQPPFEDRLARIPRGDAEMLLADVVGLPVDPDGDQQQELVRQREADAKRRDGCKAEPERSLVTGELGRAGQESDVGVQQGRDVEQEGEQRGAEQEGQSVPDAPQQHQRDERAGQQDEEDVAAGADQPRRRLNGGGLCHCRASSNVGAVAPGVATPYSSTALCSMRPNSSSEMRSCRSRSICGMPSRPHSSDSTVSLPSESIPRSDRLICGVGAMSPIWAGRMPLRAFSCRTSQISSSMDGLRFGLRKWIGMGSGLAVKTAQGAALDLSAGGLWQLGAGDELDNIQLQAGLVDPRAGDAQPMRLNIVAAAAGDQRMDTLLR